jgi:putative addiction module component (TIGR02574 family)
MAIDIRELLALPVDERLRLAELLWQSLDDPANPLPLTSELEQELARREAVYPESADVEEGRPADEVLRELRQSLWKDD